MWLMDDFSSETKEARKYQNSILRDKIIITQFWETKIANQEFYIPKYYLKMKEK